MYGEYVTWVTKFPFYLNNFELNFSIYMFTNRNVAVKLKPNYESVVTKNFITGAALKFILSCIPNDAPSEEPDCVKWTHLNTRDCKYSYERSTLIPKDQ